MMASEYSVNSALYNKYWLIDTNNLKNSYKCWVSY